MVKITSFLLASVAIMAVSAQVSTEPRSITALDLDNFALGDVMADDAAATTDVYTTEDNDVDILPYPGTHTLLRRGEPQTKPKPTKKDKSKSKPKPKPKSKAAGKKPSAKLTSEQQGILDTHNKFRAQHGAPPLTWNANAAQFGNNWIQACQFQHSRGKFGENLAAGYRDFNSAITAWYNEEKLYNYNNPGFAMGTGHFTQVVWKSTKSVGCAKKFCPRNNWNIYICEYDPPGNIVSQNNEYFRRNVLRKGSK
ncbi:hypothetical protein BGW38_003339 [Lunasporangiospora selenospora]|uniref:SCP domain-containing protein n=1 Tax=Lunasporangiospora selenospora TaxID=979761 RepID=A0A9P6FRB2_9FUNG|nr:hypothetical protein BGW38_003339 [Lunasporangiospora selenospora]